MSNRIDQKIKNILNDLREAHSRSEKFYAKDLNLERPVKPMDLFDMALAFDNEERLFFDLDLAYSEKYPERYSKDQVEHLKSEIDRLTRRIRAWQNRQFPSQFEE